MYGTRNGQYTNTWCAGVSMDARNDGNFCLYTKSGTNYWCTRKTSTDNGQYRAIIQNDGNFVIYTADNNSIWDLGTALGNIPFPYCGNGGGNPGKGDEDGGEGACCETEADCNGCCTTGVCNAACSFKRSPASY
ncbi:hypothetical protein BGX26_012624 [Mortierella sp. AD094]|nr:hypothetical protein BGX26_012624 [Mortierella sp. AD094]